VIIKHFHSFDKFLIHSRRWLKTSIPEKYAPLLNLDKFTTGRCRLLLYLVLYLWISLFVKQDHIRLQLQGSHSHLIPTSKETLFNDYLVMYWRNTKYSMVEKWDTEKSLSMMCIKWDLIPQHGQKVFAFSKVSTSDLGLTWSHNQHV